MTNFQLFFFDGLLFRLMPPYTPYYVVSTEDTVTVGGNFYMMASMRRTLIALMNEHYYGHLLTNSSRSEAGIYFFKMIAYITEEYCM